MNEDHSKIVSILEHVRKRPGMWLLEYLIDNFVAGLFLGIRRPASTQASYDRLLAENKLMHNRSIYSQLLEQGYSESDAIDKYLSILIESFESSDD